MRKRSKPQTADNDNSPFKSMGNWRAKYLKKNTESNELPDNSSVGENRSNLPSKANTFNSSPKPFNSLASHSGEDLASTSEEALSENEDVKSSSSSVVKSANSDDPIEKSATKGQSKTFKIKIPPGTKSADEFRRYAEIVIFKRVVNIDWSTNEGADDIYKDISSHVGESVTFIVSAAAIEKYAPGKKDVKKSDADYNKLEEGEKGGINAETDKRYHESTGIAPGTKIKSGETGRKEIWNDLKRQLMEQREILNNLPLEVKEMLISEDGAELKPEDYATLIQAAELLKKFSTADILDYKSKTNSSSGNPATLLASLKEYWTIKQERLNNFEKRQQVEIRLYGMEDLYQMYLGYIAKAKGPSINSMSKEDDETDEQFEEFKDKLRSESEERDQAFEDALEQNGFASAEEFGNYVNTYQKLFEKETMFIAEDRLLRYRHFLREESKKIDNPTFMSNLYQQMVGSGARQNYFDAKMMFGESNLPAPAEHQNAAYRSYLDNHMKAEGKMFALPSKVIQEDQFKREELTWSKSMSEMKKTLKDYIAEKEASIDETWDDIHSNPGYIYELDILIDASRKEQHVEAGSIFDMIINNQAKKYDDTHKLQSICFVIMFIAIALVSMGTLSPLAGMALIGMDLYAVYEAVETYKDQNEANNVGLLTDDPSLAWVVLAIVGTALDAAALNAVWQAAEPISTAAKAFDEGESLAELEARLLAVTDLDKKVRHNILRSAQLRQEAGNALKNLMKSDGAIYGTIVPYGPQFKKLVNIAGTLAQQGYVDMKIFIDQLKIYKILKADPTVKELKTLKLALENGQVEAKSVNFIAAEWKIEALPAPVRLQPEPIYLGDREHGLLWTQEQAIERSRGMDGNPPQGKWGNMRDLEYAGEQASTLTRKDGMRDFPINSDHKSIVYNIDGTTDVPDMIRVRNNGNGTWHGFPINSKTAKEIFKVNK